MKKIMGAVVVAAMMILAAESSGMAGVAQAARVTVEYGIEASLRVVPQKGMKQGVPGKITVMFCQDVSAVKNFKEATDYAIAPVFPAVEGLHVTGEPRLKTSVDEIRNNQGKHTLTSYWRMFVYPVTPERGGEFTIKGVNFDFHGKTLTAAPVTFTVEEAPTPAPTPKPAQVAPDLRRHWLKAPVKKMVSDGVAKEFNPDGTEKLEYAQALHRDEQGRLIRAEFGMIDEEYTYDDNGLMTMIQVFDKQGRIEEQRVYTYYDILEPATETYTKWFAGDAEPTVEIVTRYYKYKWDDHGNWIERIAETQNYDRLTDYQKLQYLDNTPAWYEHRALTY